MAHGIDPRQFTKAMDDALMGVANDASIALQKAIEKTAKDAAKEINANASGMFNKYGEGKYAKSWKPKRISETEWDVYSKYPGMPHLLENDHDIIVHGNKVVRYKGRPHIGPVNDKLPEQLTNNFNSFMEGHG